MVDFRNKVFCQDCLRGMEVLPDNCVDVVVTSPPYNIGTAYSSYSDSMPFGAYLDFMEAVFTEVARLLKPVGHFFLNVGQRVSDKTRAFEVMLRAGNHLELQNTIHWIKSIAVPEKDFYAGHYKPVNSYRYLSGMHEYIFHFTHDGCQEIDKVAAGVPYADASNTTRWKKDATNRDRGNTWFIPYETVQGAKRHPAAFPKRLPELCIRLSGVKEGSLVLDPFAGVGNALVAASELSMDFLGFEVSMEYVDAAIEAILEQEKQDDR